MGGAAHRSHPLQNWRDASLGIPSVMSTLCTRSTGVSSCCPRLVVAAAAAAATHEFRRHPMHRLAPLGVMTVPHSAQRTACCEAIEEGT